MNLKEAIATLPDTKDAVVAFFREKGVKGVRGSTTCAVANYLTGEVGRPVSSAYSAARMMDSTEWQYYPPGVSDFIFAFDVGKYPDLVAE